MVLEGGGPADVELPVRVAALRAEGADRERVKVAVERAVEMEAAIVAGELSHDSSAGSPLELVAEIESVVRSILRDAVLGRHGADLRAAADETLLADGLSVGEGAAALRGATAEWGVVEAEPDPTWASQAEVEELDEDAEPEPASDELEPEHHASDEYEPDSYVPPEAFEQPTRVLEGATDTLLAATETAEESGRSEPAEGEEDPEMSNQLTTQPAQVGDDWLGSSSDTLDWPERPAALRMLDNRPAERQAARNRVEHLFPRPEATDWSVKELDYSRRRQRVRV
jgi:hypothetical protein